MNFPRPVVALALLALAALAAAAPAGAAPEKLPLEGLDVPDVAVLDQEGQSLRFQTDLVAGKVVAINFIFTHCTTICPPLAATFGKLRALLGERAGRDVHLISISVDPTTDTPERLKAWSQKFGPGPGWTLVTGSREEITRLLKSLGAYTASPTEHPPLVLIGNGRGQWTRAYGLASPAKLIAAIDDLAGPHSPSPSLPEGERGEKRPNRSFFFPSSPLGRGGVGEVRAAAFRAGDQAPAADRPAAVAEQYFGNTVLLDQDGREHPFYNDLVRGKIVIMDFIYTRCVGPCPILSSTFAKLQAHLGDRLGKDVFLLSFSVDPGYDTPARLKEYAGRFKARPGWTFLTGSRENVETVLRKLGQWVESPEQHQTVYIVGNEATGLWKKAFGLAKPEELFPVIDSVIDDANPSSPGGGV